VEEADYSRARVRVRAGDMLTGWLPWVTERASRDVTWWAPEVGEQVLVLSPDGEPAQGVVLFAVYQAAHPASADRETVHRTVYEDGATIEYDRAAHRLNAQIPGDVTLTCSGDVSATVGGAAEVQAQGGIILESQTSVRLAAPKLEFDGPITHGGGGYGRGAQIRGDVVHTDGDLVSEGISLQHHVHREHDGPTTEEPQ
jgi:phage baseplate assembly protein V